MRGAANPALLVLAVVMAAAAVERYASPAGGLQLPSAQSVEPSHPVYLGSLAYPREAVDADGIHVRIPHPSRRIASQYWSIDEYVYALAPPANVVAVSASAYEPTVSNVLAEVRQFQPAIAADPERVLRLNPDLVLVSSTGRADFTSLVRSTGVPVFRMHTTFESLQEVEDTIRITGYVTGTDIAATRVAERFHDAIQKARARRPQNAPVPRILGLGGTYGYGSRTLFDDIAHTLGAVNVSAEAGLVGYTSLDFEQIVRWNPQWIFSGAAPGQADQVLSQLRSDPAIALTDAARNGHIVVIDNRVFYPMSPYTSALVKAMATALYPAAPANGGKG